MTASSPPGPTGTYGPGPAADGPGTYVHVETGCDDAFTCTDTTTTLFRGRSAAHNLALWRDADGLYALGGLGNGTWSGDGDTWR